MKKYKHILVSNDDGYNKYGITLLANKLLEYAEHVTVIAPFNEQSAKSQAITCHTGLDVIKQEGFNYECYSVNGTPADCVRVGLALFKDVDLVVTGINDGMNIGVDTLYSGTVGAATQANLAGISAIAFSGPRHHLETVVNLLDEALLKAFEISNIINEMYLLNINFPAENTIYKGIKLTHLGYFADSMEVEMYGDGNFHFTKYNLDYDKSDEYIDYIAYLDGYTTITPLTYDKTNYRHLNKLKKVL